MGFFLHERGNQSLSGYVLNTLGSRIVRGDIKSGQTITEADLAQEFDVSRSVIRDVVKTLTALRIIKVKPKVGIQLQPVEKWDHFDENVLRWRYETTPPDIFYHQMMQMRLAFEPLACALAAQYASDSDVARIKELGEKLYEMHSNGETGKEALDIDMEFHMAIHIASGNPLLLPIGRIISGVLDVTMKVRPESLRLFAPYNLRVAQAIYARDVETARAEMAAAMQSIYADTSQYIEKTAAKA